MSKRKKSICTVSNCMLPCGLIMNGGLLQLLLNGRLLCVFTKEGDIATATVTGTAHNSALLYRHYETWPALANKLRISVWIDSSTHTIPVE